MRRLVERAEHPPAVRVHDQSAHRAVVHVHERERPAGGGLPADLADDASVRDRHRDSVRPGLLDNATYGRAHASAERLERLGAGNDVPTLLLEDLAHERIALGDADAELPALPLPEMDLGELGD